MFTAQRYGLIIGAAALILVVLQYFNTSITLQTHYFDPVSIPKANYDEHGRLSHRDVHLQQIGFDDRVRKTPYPKRTNMGACPPLFGRVLIFVAYVESSMKTHYHVAQMTLQCYLKSANYTVAMVDLDNDRRVKNSCGNHKQLFFKKHCAASVYLTDADWMLVLDADAGVVNPNHCIEEWIDDRVNLIFYERFFNWEIASGNYLARNSEFSLNFLKRWASWEWIQPQNWNGADNGVLQMHLLQTLIPDAQQEITNCDAIWHRSTGYNSYMAFVTCVKVALGATRLWPGKVRVLRRAHGWVRDGFLTNDMWSERDFMLHGWKLQDVNETRWQSPFPKTPDPNACGDGMSGWEYRDIKKISVEEVRQKLASFEKGASNTFPKEAKSLSFLTEPDVGACYPHCDDAT